MFLRGVGARIQVSWPSDAWNEVPNHGLCWTGFTGCFRSWFTVYRFVFDWNSECPIVFGSVLDWESPCLEDFSSG